MSDFDYIREKLPYEELLCQLAEEGAELSHAALKLRRVLDGTNPTPVTYEEATANLFEEIADILNILTALQLVEKHHAVQYAQISMQKSCRWCERLKEKYGE
ncbi:MAG: hypothetical protein J6Q53_05055 [Oscillospiraceae bacterium]|nr:hypothetical protein [Oscillospiraceae bacterium]